MGWTYVCFSVRLYLFFSFNRALIGVHKRIMINDKGLSRAATNLCYFMRNSELSELWDASMDFIQCDGSGNMANKIGES